MIKERTVNIMMITILVLVVLFNLYAALVPEAQTAGDELNATGVPLGSIFSSNGFIFLIIMAAFIILLFRKLFKVAGEID